MACRQRVYIVECVGWCVLPAVQPPTQTSTLFSSLSHPPDPNLRTRQLIHAHPPPTYMHTDTDTTEHTSIAIVIDSLKPQRAFPPFPICYGIQAIGLLDELDKEINT